MQPQRRGDAERNRLLCVSAPLRPYSQIGSLLGDSDRVLAEKLGKFRGDFGAGPLEDVLGFAAGAIARHADAAFAHARNDLSPTLLAPLLGDRVDVAAARARSLDLRHRSLVSADEVAQFILADPEPLD